MPWTAWPPPEGRLSASIQLVVFVVLGALGGELQGESFVGKLIHPDTVRDRHRSLHRSTLVPVFHSRCSLSAELPARVHEKWVHARQDHLGELLAAKEMTALNGLASSFDKLRTMRPLPLDKITLLQVTAAAALPMLPVIMAKIPLTDLLRIIFRAAF